MLLVAVVDTDEMLELDRVVMAAGAAFSDGEITLIMEVWTDPNCSLVWNVSTFLTHRS